MTSKVATKAALSLAIVWTISAPPSEPQANRGGSRKVQFYQRTRIVSPVPGDALASGGELLQAVAQIQPTASEPWLILLEPGIYDLDTEKLTMKPWLGIEGAGIALSVIRSLGQEDASFDRQRGTVIGADNAELRDLTVECLTKPELGRSRCIAMANPGASPRVSRVRLTAVGQAGEVHWGMRNSDGSPAVDQVEIIATGGEENYGIVNARLSFPSIRRSTVVARNGSLNNFGILNREDGAPTVVTDTRITAAGGNRAAGIASFSSSLRRSVELVDVVIEAGGASHSYGILDGDLDLEIRNSRIHCEVPGSAVDLGALGRVSIIHSELVGSEVLAAAEVVEIGATWLRGEGLLLGLSSLSCAGVFTLDPPAFFTEGCPESAGQATYRRGTVSRSVAELALD